MAGHSSLAAEVLEAINMPNLKPIPSYLSEDDAVTVDMFMQSEYAHDYMIDTSNIHWGGEIHHSHVFDIYAMFSPTKDPVKARLDMLQFVTANRQRYDWNTHLYLRMNSLTLGAWIQKMTFWDNCADALAIYSLSNMLGIHTTILSRSKPWTTISGDFQGDVYDLLSLSTVNLVYLGRNQYARLWRKAVPESESSSYMGPNFNYAPLVNIPDPTTEEELNTAHTLLELHDNEPLPKTTEPTTTAMPSVHLYDAIDKITE